MSWSGVKDPDTHDWIGVYVLDKSGDTLDPKTRAPVKYQVNFILMLYMQLKNMILNRSLVNIQCIGFCLLERESSRERVRSEYK